MAPGQDKFGRTADGKPRAITAQERNKIVGKGKGQHVIGSVFDPNTRLFSDYKEGLVFDYDFAEPKKIGDMLKRDGKARSIEQALSLPIRAAEVQIAQPRETEKWRNAPDAPDGEAAEQEVLDFVRETITPLLPRLIAQMTSAIAHRKAFFEKVYKFEDGKVVYDEICYRQPHVCDQAWDIKSGERRGFRQRLIGTPLAMPGVTTFNTLKKNSQKTGQTGYVHIPHQKSFIYVHGAYRDPMQGHSDLDVSYWAYETRQKIMFLWFQYLENQSLPRTIVFGNTQGEANQLAEAISGLRSAGVLGLPFTNDPDRQLFQTLESSGAGANQFIEAINYLEGQMSASVLTGFMDLTNQSSNSSGNGSYALSADQSEFFLSARQAVADEMAEAITNDIIAPLVYFNFGDVPVPKVVIGPLSRAETERSMTLLNSVVTAPQLNIPREFVDMLLTHVSTYLGLDENKVETQVQEDKVKRDEQDREDKRLEQEQKQMGINVQADNMQGAAFNRQMQERQQDHSEKQDEHGRQMSERQQDHSEFESQRGREDTQEERKVRKLEARKPAQKAATAPAKKKRPTPSRPTR